MLNASFALDSFSFSLLIDSSNSFFCSSSSSNLECVVSVIIPCSIAFRTLFNDFSTSLLIFMPQHFLVSKKFYQIRRISRNAKSP